ncbi:MAG: hypothetical protein OHK0046_41200 [Anaerolineae bacterium]
MPVLLLAQGEPAAKNLLRQAIEARYGHRPPAMDSLILDFKGRARIRIGPVNTWVPIDATAYFRFPTAMRWDFTLRPLKMPVQRGIDSFDGEYLRSLRGGRSPEVVENVEHIHSMRSRLWAMASIMLTPLSDLFVNLALVDENRFEATNTRLQDTALVSLRGNGTMHQVRVHCLNPDQNRMQDYVIDLADSLTTLNGLLLPERFCIGWNDAEAVELEPIRVEANAPIGDHVFRLDDAAYA